MSHIYKKEKCRSMKKEMWKHEKKKCSFWMKVLADKLVQKNK